MKTVLFIGDSITDCGRDRDDPDSLGTGYVARIAEWHALESPGAPARFINRGNSGNRAADLRRRWTTDCLELEPDVVSIMIGINDTWRRYDRGDPTSAEEFATDYREILTRTAEIGARLVLVEPFLLPVRAEQWEWRADLDPKIAVVRRLAVEFRALFVATDGPMAQAGAASEPTDWVRDGVHPTAAGHALLARAWLNANQNSA
jgi:lysophospholipase L1-like esterase